MKQAAAAISRPQDLTEEVLNNYLKQFLEIGDFKSIDNGRSLLEIIKNNAENGRVKAAIRKVVGLFCCDSPAARVCALQFLKEAVETGCFYVVQHMQRTILPFFIEIVEYRSSIDNIQRGSTFFVKEMDKNMGDEDLINLMKLSSTFFRMAHECLFVWGAIYFPGSLFDKTRIKMQKKITFPEFPRDFKFFSENKVNSFKTNCQALIKKMQERILTESVGAATRRSLSEDRNMSNSPRKIKETREVSKVKKAESKKSARQLQKKRMEEEKYQVQQDILPPPSKSKKQKSKKSSKQARKQFIESKQLLQQKTIQNSSVKLRKKNSFNEAPFDLHPSSPQAQQSPTNSSTSLKKQHPSNPNTNHNNTIAENQESQGGRYSVQETISKQSEEISEIMYDYNQRQSLSPRSQYSLVNKDVKGKLKKEISEQLPHSKAANLHHQNNNKKQQNVIIQKYPKHQAKPPTPRNKQKPYQDQITTTKNQPKQKQSFNLSLGQLKRQQQMKEIKEVNPSNTQREKQKKTKRGQVSARKKFVSSQEESVKEIKQHPKPVVQQAKNLLQSKSADTDQEYISPFKEKKQKPQKLEVVSASKEEQNRAVPALPPRSKEINVAPQIAPVVPLKASKPMKLKSKTNLKTVFQSSDYKIVECSQSKRPQEKTNQRPQSINNKNQQKKQTKKMESKPRERISIYEAVEIDTIQTIKQVPTVRQRNQKKGDAQVQKVQTVKQIKGKLSQNTEKEPQYVPISKMAQSKQVAQTLQKLVPQIQEQPRVKTNINSSKQISKQQFVAIHQGQRQQPRHFKAIRNDTIYSSRRFRNFKQVSLFIQPKTLSPKHSDQMNRTDELRVTIDESFQSTIKEQLFQQFNRLKSTILEQSMSRTQAILKSQINSERKESSEIKVECSTQTKIKHKSKGKFERKGKYMLLSDNQPQENTSQLNLPKVVSSKPNPNSNSNSRQTLERKNSIGLQKQQLKPNTLLHALYKRRSINS